MRKNYLWVFMLIVAGLFFSCEQMSGAGGYFGPGNEPGPEDETGLEAQIIGIKIISPPETRIYGRNQTFDPAGLEVGWLYDDDSTVPMEDDKWLIDGEPDMARYIAQKVTVKAADYGDDEAYQDSFYIAVMDSDKVLNSITVRGPTNTVQVLGLDFDKTGLVVTGHFSDGSSQNLTSFAAIVGYDKKWRGEQTLTAKVNRKTAPFTITTRIGESAGIAINIPFYGIFMHDDHQKEYKESWLKGEAFTGEKLNIRVFVSPSDNTAERRDKHGKDVCTLSYGPGGITDADLAATMAAYKPNQPGAQSVPFSIDGKDFTLNLFVIDTEPDVWFDYGYMRHAGDPKGAGKGAGIDNGKYYARANETIVIAPVRYLVGYNADHSTAAGTAYNWTVGGDNSARTYTTSGGGELLHITPNTAGTYTISVSVTGKNYITGGNITKTATTELVCYGSALPAGTFVSPLKNFACGQMSEGGTGFGWSLGSAGGYEVWTVEHRASYKIEGNAFAGWQEAGIVWVQEDRNGNGLPDEMWYELRGCDDDDPAWKDKITRRYAVTYVKGPGHGTVNEYNQLIRLVYWADSRGRAGRIPGGFPDTYWGVSGNSVTYTLTMLRDDSKIATGEYSGTLFSAGGYVDAFGENYYIKDAMRADGTPITLSAVKFIKVQTAVFRYGGVFGDASTEIASADFLGRQTDFTTP
jgi:hypothetical protein